VKLTATPLVKKFPLPNPLTEVQGSMKVHKILLLNEASTGRGVTPHIQQILLLFSYLRIGIPTKLLYVFVTFLMRAI
jgi:hypothetical protein